MISVKVILSLAAHIELAEAIQWTTEGSVDRGSALNDAYDEVERRIADHHEWFPEVEPGIRRALLKRFRYSVFFVVRETEIEIVAFAHQSRRPDYWRDRVP